MSAYLPFSGSPKFSGEFTINPTEVAADSDSTQTFTIAGLTTDMIPVIAFPSITTGIRNTCARVSAADTLEITFRNSTVGAIDLGAISVYIICF